MTDRDRINVFVDQSTVDLMEAVKVQTGLSLSEQVRRGLRLWLAQNHPIHGMQGLSAAAAPYETAKDS